MHDELTTPEAAANRLAHDTYVHVIRQGGQLWMVRVAIPESWDHDDFTGLLTAALATKDLGRPRVHCETTDGEPRLLSVMV